jgi:hypothetical protein
MTTRTVLAVLALVLLAGLPAPATATALDDLGRVYAFPADVEQAREACFRAEEHRIEREFATYIPADEATYVAWFDQGGPAVDAWGDAVQACQDQHTQPGGKWNWDALIFVGYGHLP